MQKILQYFHHIHHKNNAHEVHHCGGSHVKNFPKLNYTIRHCSCGKHRINKKIAMGHDFNKVEKTFEFFEKCRQGGWHLESGKNKK